MKFLKYIKLNNQFQNSINLGLDLEDLNKVNSYIPTTTGNTFLHNFLDDVLDKNRTKSSLVIAPYGKGKSHAILVLLNLLRINDFASIEPFIGNISSMDKNLLTKIKDVKEKKYLPVIISNTRGSLNQSLMNSLQKSLNDYGLTDLKLETDYSDAIDRINHWKNNYPEVYSDFVALLIKEKINEEIFITRLKRFDEDSYDLFCDLHKQLLAGTSFVPNNSMEIVDYYKEIKNQITTKYGFDGIYIVFDEFSKFIESRNPDTISNDMKIIQDLCELSNSMNDNSMYFMMVLHKPINAYRKLDLDIKNAFKGIEGRVSSYYFHSTIKNSFELVYDVIKKNNAYLEVKKQNKSINQGLTKVLLEIPAINTEFSNDFIETKLIDSCYPLNPLTLYSLIRISEKVAQNERTLFTFLLKESPYSLSQTIKTDYPYKYILPSLVYDYFEKNLIEDEDNLLIHRIANSVKTALTYIDNNLEIELVKALALVLIINEKSLLPANYKVLSACTLINEEDGKDAIDNLVDKNILVKRKNGCIEFKINMNKDIQIEISNLVNTKYSKMRLNEELNLLSTNKYIYPRVYNMKNAITRFFRVEYIDEETFLNVDDSNYWFNAQLNDGIIFNVIRKQNNNIDLIKKHVSKLNNPRLLVVYPNKYINYTDTVKKIKALESLIETSESEDRLLSAELNQMRSDLRLELDDKLNTSYSIYTGEHNLINSYNDNVITTVKRALSKERILGEILSTVFYATPIVNLELLNKEYIKSTYKKARFELIEKILKGYLQDDDCINAKTSPLDTIINCLLVETGIKPHDAEKLKSSNFIGVLDAIDEFIDDKSGSFIDLYTTLQKPPYGIRRGIIPVLLANSISMQSKSIIILYKNNIEVEISPDIIERINEDPESYSFKQDDESTDKIEYIQDLIKLFNINTNQNDYIEVANAIRDWYHKLPKFTKQMIGKDESLNRIQIKRLKKYLSQPDSNSSELILEIFPSIFRKEDYSFVNELKIIKELIDSYKINFSVTLKNYMNEQFGFSKGTNIINSCSMWFRENNQVLDKKVLSQSHKSFKDMFEKVNHDEDEFNIINSIAYYLTGLFIEDWSNNTITLFKQQFEDLIEASKDQEESSNELIINIDGNQIHKTFSEELDDSTELIENIITDAIDDFGDTISSEQKIALLVKIMKKYI
ncbi:MAG: hypothetical protein ACLROI_07065 [Beduini sp.]|uniref:hypothetical protein n=1 Tax=Beduini sp. TaxID=1922300 RepID=UPI0011C9A340